jgi:hypothetical protein
MPSNQTTGNAGFQAGFMFFEITLQAENGSVVQYADQIVVLRP